MILFCGPLALASRSNFREPSTFELAGNVSCGIALDAFLRISLFEDVRKPSMGQHMQWEDTEIVARQRRSWVRRLVDYLGIGRTMGAKGPIPSAQFTSAFVALAAKMAKADGVAVAVEWEALEKFLDVPAAEIPNIRRFYDQAKADLAGAESYIERIAAMLGEDAALKRDVLECLMFVACADGVLHPAEDIFLLEVATAFGMSQADFRSIRAMFVEVADDPYVVLGLKPDAKDADIKAKYRKLVAQNHPDRLIAAGAPATIVKAATAKLAAINAAHEAILKERQMGGRG